MKAGIDLGTTLIKAVWQKEGAYKFASTANVRLEELVKKMNYAGIEQVRLIGTGYQKGKEIFKEFEIKIRDGDPIKNEIELQAEGAKILLELENKKLDTFLLVSIGTGTSYTIINKNETKRFPLGNSIGGGFIMGLGEALGAKSYTEITETAANGTPLDFHIRDVLKEKRGSFEGKLVISSFSRVTSSSNKKDIYASLMSCVAVSIIRDIMWMGLVKKYTIPKNVVYIGSAIASNVLLKHLLLQYSSAIGKKPHFLEKGEFTLAMGAYHMGKEEGPQLNQEVDSK